MFALAAVPTQSVPRAEAVQWYEPGVAVPNESEMLFYAFLLIFAAPSVGKLNEWAAGVADEAAAALASKEKWRPSTDKFAVVNKVSSLFDPMANATANVRDEASLERIAAAMRFSDGPGVQYEKISHVYVVLYCL